MAKTVVGLVLVVVAAALLVVVDARLAPHFLSVGTGVSMPSAVKDKYHTTDFILSELEKTAGSCAFMTRHEVEAVDPANNAPRKNTAYTLTDPSTPKDNKKRFMLTFGMHGREYISSETALRLSKFVCNKMAGGSGSPSESAQSIASAKMNMPSADEVVAQPASQKLSMEETSHALLGVGLGQQMDKSRLQSILKNTEITFIPVLNIDGRKKVENGASCTAQRKNGRNVDINRNFADWFNPSNASPADEDYQGPNAMSEWENNIVKALAEQFHPHAFVDVHSGDLGMGYVYGHSGHEKSAHDDLNRRWMKGIDDEVFQGSVWFGNLANMGSMPYESHGSSCDYMYRSQHAKISGTWEIWRKPSFFSFGAASSSNNNNALASAKVASKFDYVSTNVVPISTINAAGRLVHADSNALQVEGRAVQDELMSLVQAAVNSDGHNEELGLTRADVQELVQTMKDEGKSTPEIQTLLQDMSREQCFAYFNPVMPEHYEQTVSNFALAVLVGAEKLSSADFSASLH